MNEFENIPSDGEFTNDMTIQPEEYYYEEPDTWKSEDESMTASEAIREDYFGFDEYNDWDATACANGDYNTWEENEIFNDNEF